MTAETEIESARTTTHLTRRNTVHALEDILYLEHNALDHGFVRVIDYMGDDAAIVQAARVSYGAGTKSVSDDRGLIRHLMRNRHSSPLEMCEIKLHIKLPIFVARQWIRHRTANVNEYSARYSLMAKEFYVPEIYDLATQSQTNKQGRDDVLQGDKAERVLQILTEDAARSYGHYKEMVDPDGIGLARELARMNLPVNIYTQWYWKIDLHNLLHFLSLRADPHAQHEIRVYADIIFDMVKKWVPVAAEAFEDYVVGGAHISRAGLIAIRRMIAGENIEDIAGASGMSSREWVEFMGKLKAPSS